MKKRIGFLISIICVIIFCLSFNSYLVKNDKALNNKNKIEIAVYSNGSLDTYYFVLNPDTGKMLVQYGTRSRGDIDLKKGYFMMGGRRFETKKERLYLSSDENDEIINLLDLIYADENSNYRSLVADSWGIAIYYNNSVVQNNSYYNSDKMKELIEFLRDKTSIEMKLQGFA